MTPTLPFAKPQSAQGSTGSVGKGQSSQACLCPPERTQAAGRILACARKRADEAQRRQRSWSGREALGVRRAEAVRPVLNPMRCLLRAGSPAAPEPC
jgi:hypothetical protein